MCARSPTATLGEPVLSSAGRLVARTDETKRETQRFSIPNTRFVGNVPTWNPPSFAEGLPTKLHGRTAEESHLGPAFREVPHALLLPALEDEFQKKCVLVFISLQEQCVGLKKSRRLRLRTLLRRCCQFFGYQFPNIQDA